MLIFALALTALVVVGHAKELSDADLVKAFESRHMDLTKMLQETVAVERNQGNQPSQVKAKAAAKAPQPAKVAKVNAVPAAKAKALDREDRCCGGNN